MTQPPEPKRTLIPQYSIRWMLSVTALAAVVFSFVALGIRGNSWALAVAVAVAGLVILMAAYALAFGAVWVFSLISSSAGRKKDRSGRSPFRETP